MAQEENRAIFPRRIVVPAHLVPPKGDALPLLESVGLNRRFRRQCGLSEAELVNELLTPKHRMMRFWLCALPRAIGARHVRVSKLPSVDFAWLHRYSPSFLSHVNGSSLPLKQFPELGKVREKIDQISKEEDASVSFDERPFDVWTTASEEVSRWDSLPEHARRSLVEALAGLDGISGTTLFSDFAARHCSGFQEYVVELGARQSNNNAAPSCIKEMGAPLVDTASPWSGGWRAVRDLADEALCVEPSEAPLSAIRELVDDLTRHWDEIASRANRANELAGVLRKLVSQLADAAIKNAFTWLDQTCLAAFEDHWLAIIRGNNQTNQLDVLATEIQTKLETYSTQRESRECVSYELAVAREQIKAARSPRDKREQLERRTALQRQVDEIEQSMAVLEDDLYALVFEAPNTIELGRPLKEPREANAPVEAVPGSPATTPASAWPEAAEVRATPSERELADHGEKPGIGGRENEPSHGAEAVLNREATPPPGEGAVAIIETTNQPPQQATMEAEQSFDEPSGERCRPIWRALRDGNPGLAFQIANALVNVAPEIKVPPVALLQAVALAGYVEGGHGQIALALQDCYARIDRVEFEQGPTDWRMALSLLLLAATLRPSLMAPNTGATGLIAYAHPGPHLHKLREAVVRAGERLQGKAISRASFAHMDGAEAWNQRASGFLAELEQWKRHAAVATIKFQAATDVWRRLQEPEGLIGRLIRHLESFEAPQTAAVAAEISLLANAAEFQRLVNHIDRQELRRRRGDDIHAGALVQLQDKARDVVELAERWLELVQSAPSTQGFVATAVQELMQQIHRLRPLVEAEIESLVAKDGPWQLVQSASFLLLKALDELEGLQRDAGNLRSEPSAKEVLGRCLLLAPTIDIGDEWQAVQSPSEVLSALADSPCVDAKQSFDARIARGDFIGARRLIEAIEETDDTQADALRVPLAEELAASRHRLTQRLGQVRHELESALAFGYLGENDRSILDRSLIEISDSVCDLERFTAAEHELGEIREQIARFRNAAFEAVREQLTELKLPEGSEDFRRLDSVIQSGDVFVANEYIERIRGGQPLPSGVGTGRDCFAAFFPEGARAANTVLEEIGNGGSLIVDAIQQAKKLGPFDFSEPESAQRESARRLASRWFSLKRSPGTATAAQLTELLTGLGFVGVATTTKATTPRGERAEFEASTEPLCDRSICPVSWFGSHAKGRYRVVCIWGRPVDEDLPRHVGEGTSIPTLVLYFGRMSERHRRNLARTSRLQRHKYLVLDDVLMLYLCAERGSRLAAFFACTLPFSYVEPFVTTSGLVPPEMFFGRRDELRAVVNSSAGCFVYGGRQLGKTALLRAAEREFHRPAEHHWARWIDLKAEGVGTQQGAEHVWGVIHRALSELGAPFDRLKPLRMIRRAATDEFLMEIRALFPADRNRRLLLLLDEADKFLEQDARDGYPQTQKLKNLMETTERRIKVVFAGLHNVLRITEQANHPLAHLGDPIEIGPLARPGESTEARAMIVGPLRAAGYELASDSLAVRMLAQTNYYPVLIQLYGEELLRVLNDPNRRRFDPESGPRYVVTEAVVDETYMTKSLREAIRSRFKYTLELDPRYEVIVYAFANALLEQQLSFRDGADAAEIKRRALVWWAEGFSGTTEHEFRIILDEMVGLGVLRHEGDRGYSLRNPNVLRLLGTAQDVADVLLRKRELPQEFEPATFRAADADARCRRRSPLTYAQQNRLLRNESGVALITGLAAAGLGDLQHFIVAAGAAVSWRSDLADLQAFRRVLEKLGDRKAGTTVVALSSEVPWSSSWIELALERTRKLESKEKVLRVVFVADSKTLWQNIVGIPTLEARGLEVHPLRPWSDGFVRQWLEDLAVPGADRDARMRLQEVTGYWPNLLGRLPERLARLDQGTEYVREWRGRPEARSALLDEFELSAAQHKAALCLVRDCPGEPVETLREFAPEYRAIDPDDVPAWLAWAETLQLVRREAMGWSVNPVVASALDP
jgi:hypothetical protein